MTDLRIILVRSFLGFSDGIRYQRRTYNFPNVKEIRDLCYSEANPNDLMYTLDLYLPEKTSQLLPVLIDIHGGGFVYGDKCLNQWTASEMASRGYAVVSLNYPLLPEVTIMDQIKAVQQAVEYVVSLSDPYPMDMDRVFLKGDSAGGFLAMLTAANSRTKGSSWNQLEIPLEIKGLVLIHPMLDIDRKDLLAYSKAFFIPKEERGRSPASLLLALPPTWIVSSRNDVMFNGEARIFVRWMRRLKKTLCYHEFGYTLKRPLIHIFMVSMNTLPESQQLYNSLDQFLRWL